MIKAKVLFCQPDTMSEVTSLETVSVHSRHRLNC